MEQKIQFTEQKAKELTDTLEKTISNYESRIKTDRDDHHRDMKERIARLEAEKENVDA